MPIEHSEENRTEQPRFRPFNEMVAKLFKHEGFNTNAANIMHAAVGISGEATEFVYFDNTQNFIEEAGDLEFYLEALYQSAELAEASIVLIEARAEHGDTILPTELCFNQILRSAADILDFSKKMWVYHKPLDTAMKTNLAANIGMIQGALLRLYAWKGISREEVIQFNQAKLAIRYPDGVYSNFHAQARLDKQGA